jgi:menaquinol-cytochrome c reductase iron-sulfur subunit
VDGPPDHPPRRSFLLRLGAVLASVVAGIVPVGAGLIAFLNPLHEKRPETGMTLVTKLAVLPESGAPRRFTIQADRVDGWTTHVNSPVGSVYLRRTEDGVAALNVVCPHAGCFVGIASDEGSFACPCHGSSFDLEGTVSNPSSPSPRSMDALEVEIRNGDEVWVRHQSFRVGVSEKTALA